MRRALFVLGVVCFLGAPSMAKADEPPPNANEAEARAHFAAGVNLVRDPAKPRYEEAYTEFKKAYALAGSPKILGNIGLCAMKLERDKEAIDAYTRYLAEVADLSAEEKEQVTRDLNTLKATTATITVETNPPNATIIDRRVPTHGEPIINVYGPITGKTELGIRQGYHTFKARFEGGREVTWEADIKGGESHVFDLPPAPPTTPTPTVAPVETTLKPEEPSRPIPTSVYISGGATLALGAGALVTGLLALSTNSEFNEKNSGTDPAGARDLRSTGTTLNVVSDVLLIGTLIGAGVTTYLFLTRPPAAEATKVGRARYLSPLVHSF